jgi:glyoxylase-like metal-dependent hydrolase (beta-lactamase superfamily II)
VPDGQAANGSRAHVAGAEGPLDLRFQGVERVIGVYLLGTDDGPALLDCGPSTCVDALEERLGERGVDLADVRHLLLSHIHLDHAGAAGVLVRRNPALQVHVSPVGLPHLVDPARLERSARRLYGESFDTLWGELAPVPEANVRITSARVLGLDCFPAPGHASHHVCYLDRDGTLFAGDAAGVRIEPSRRVAPPTPPPDLDPEAWERTLDEIERRAPARIALIHFGVFADVGEHLAQLRRRLRDWVETVRTGASEEEFVAHAGRELADGDAAVLRVYENAMPLWQSYAGLKRYSKRRAARA